jgi:hypothetical protein
MRDDRALRRLTEAGLIIASLALLLIYFFSH